MFTVKTLVTYKNMYKVKDYLYHIYKDKHEVSQITQIMVLEPEGNVLRNRFNLSRILGH